MNDAKPMPKVTITTDGGCDPNPGPGAWAAILRYGAVAKSIVGIDAATTNNRMEMTAIASALEALKEPCEVTLRTDSQVSLCAIKAGSLAPDEPKRARWQRKAKNPDLVQRIWTQLARHRVSVVWVKGHAGDPDNEACDQACTQAMQKARVHAKPVTVAPISA